MQCLKIFEETLPKKPYCTDDFNSGISPRTKNIAVKKLHIQPNGPTHLKWMAFDIDLPNAGLKWDEANMPPPNLSIMNPANGHCHYLYLLETAIRTATNGSIKAVKYASAVQNSLRAELGADFGYAGLIVKNPLNPHWITKEWRNEGYTLDELADYLDLSRGAANERQPNYGLGRNSNLFDDLRLWSYREIRNGYSAFQPFYEKCFTAAMQLNSYLSTPMQVNEIKNISKSVAKWTFANFDMAKFSAVQAERGALGGKAKGKNKREVGTQMLKHGVSLAKIMEELEVSRATVFNWKKTI